MHRKEEDKSYSAAFLVAAVVLVVATGVAIRREAVDLRPWKLFQRAYYSAEQEKLARQLHETRTQAAGGHRDSGGLMPIASAASANQDSHASNRAAAKSRIEELQRSLKESEQAPITIQQVYVPELGVVDRCQSCHVGIDKTEALISRQPFTPHPGRALLLGPHPPDRLGCTVCHAGQGRATSSVDKAHGRVDHWETPLLQREHTSASCLKCHSQQRVDTLRGATNVAAGAELLRRYACYGCHTVTGFESLPRPGPPLRNVGEKINYSYLVKWIKAPRSIVPDARMPDFQLTDEQAHNIADFLFSFTRRARIDVSATPLDQRTVEQGKRLYNTSRCSICHRVDDLGGAFRKVYAPDLSVEGSKIQSLEWIADRIAEPSKYVPDTVMPRFRFTGDERRQIAAYMAGELLNGELEDTKRPAPRPIARASIEKGRELVAKFGCFGCHEIPGFEKEGKLGADLGRIGAKPIERFDFAGVGIAHDRAAWIQTKLKTPRAFRGDLRMPTYHLEEGEVQALATFLLGLTGEEIPAEFTVRTTAADFVPTGPAGKLIDDLKCLTCHSIRGRGGKFAPDLSFEGSAIEATWLKQFLKAPDLIRPLLEQMPKFNLTDEESRTLADYITMTLTDPRIPEPRPPADLAEVASGRELYDRHGCRACHQMAAGGGAVGPSLTEVGRRLTAGYLFARTRDARAFRPGIVEPHYGFTDAQAAALAAYLKTQAHHDVARR